MSNMTTQQRTAWSRFPIWFGIAMGLVFAVNARFIELAVTTFPGEASNNDFDTSNDYNRILLGVDRQNALGWHIRADATSATPVIVVADRQGRPLNGASVHALARRPLGREADVPVTFAVDAPTRFALATALPSGQWDLLLTISVGGQEMRVTRRVLVR